MGFVRRRSPDLLAALFGASSVVHLARPQTLEALIPGWLPHPRTVVTVSGIIELLCAIALLRRWQHSGVVSALVLAAIFPGNVQMAITAVSDANGDPTVREVLTLVRLPLQVPLIWMALEDEHSPPLAWAMVARRA